MSALLSIQSHRVIEPSYFARLRRAVADAVAFFEQEEQVPEALIHELLQSATILRNEAIAFPERTAACVEMADWLEARAKNLGG